MTNEYLDTQDSEGSTGPGDTIDLWELLWTLEHEAASLNSAAGDLLRHEELFGDEAYSRRHRRRAPDWRVTYERPIADWRELYDDSQPDSANSEADRGVQHSPDAHAEAAAEDPAAENRRPRAASFTSQIKPDAPGPDAHGVTGSFRNAVYGIDTAAPAARLRDLLHERSFDKLWVEGTAVDGDRFAEFFAEEGFGRAEAE